MPSGATFRASCLALIAFGCGGSQSPGPAQENPRRVHFTDVAQALGLERENVCGSYENRFILESLGSGAAWFDFDLDGDLDLYVVNGSRLEIGAEVATNQLYRNDGDGEPTSFTEIAAQRGVACERWGIGCAVGDIDGDARPDLYVANFGNNRMYVNREGGFEDAAEASGILDGRMSTSSVFGDYDNDGDLDLYVANYLRFNPLAPPNEGRPCHWQTYPVYCGPDGLTPQKDGLYENDGAGNFEDVSAPSGIDAEAGFGLGVIFCDYDVDGDADIYVANDSTPNFLFQNQGDRTFLDLAIALGAGHSEDGQEQAGMGVDAGDFDNDGDPDLFVTNFSNDYNTLYRNESGNFFKDVSAFAGLVHTSVYSLGWGAHFADFDNDGWLDLFVANGHVYPQADEANTNTTYRQQNHFFWNTKKGTFQQASAGGQGSGPIHSSRGSALGDFDGDGDLDIYVVNEGAPPSLLRNDGAPAGGPAAGWLRVRLRGIKANRFGIGTHLRLHTAQGLQTREIRRGAGFASSQEPVAHFGLGIGTAIEFLEVRWPGGETQSFRNLPERRTVLLTQGQERPEVLPPR